MDGMPICVVILLGMIVIFLLCCFGAVIEEEWHKRKEAKKWQDWANKRRKE